MESLFHYESATVKLLIRVANLLIVSLLWSLSCIPVITVTASCAAMYHTVAKTVSGSGQGVVRDFLSTFLKELKQGCGITLLLGASGALAVVCVYCGLQVRHLVPGMIYLVLACILGAAWLGIVMYIPAALSRYQTNIPTLVRIALYLAMDKPVRTSLMLLALALIGVMCVYFPMFLFICPGIFTDIFCGSIERSMEKVSGTPENMPEEAEISEQQEEISALQLDEQMRIAEAEEESICRN